MPIKWHFKYDNRRLSHTCGHGWCSDCRTRRGRNRGNRNLRHAVKRVLRGWPRGQED